MKFKRSCGRRCVLQNLANITRRGIQRKRPGIPREISRSEGYPPSSLFGKFRKGSELCAMPGTGGRGVAARGTGVGVCRTDTENHRVEETGGAGGWGWSPSPQPAPAFPNRPAARRKHPEPMRPGPAHPTPTRALRRAALRRGDPPGWGGAVRPGHPRARSS